MENDFQHLDFQHLTVAILTSDIAEGKKLSDALREFGIFAHYHQELGELWVALNDQRPDLVIVDVTKMSQGPLVFKNHPRVLNDSLNFAFYYKDQDKFLLNSTFHLNHLGLIRSEIALKGQLENTLAKLTHQTHLLKREGMLKARIDRLQKRSAKLISDINENVRFHENFKSLNDLVDYLEKNSGKNSFIDVFCQMFSDWESVRSFGVYALNQSGQKLTGHHFNRKGYHHFPQLWLGQNCEQGIESFAVEMATQVSMDVMGAQVRTLCIKGEYDDPDYLVFFEVDEEQTETFNWNLFERLASGVYAKNLLRGQTKQERTRVISSWEALNIHDDLHYNQQAADVKIINVSFAKIVNQIKNKYGNRFFWKAFYQDFIYQLDQQLGESCFYSEYGVHELMIFCEKEDYEKTFMTVKTFVKAFGYWKYFEDSSVVLAKDSTPNVSLIPASSVQFLRMVDQDIDDLQSAISLASKRASQVMASSEV